MISDVLAEALDDIEHYQRSEPEMYGELEHEIGAVKLAMRRLRQLLDIPEPSPPHSEAMASMAQAIERADEEWPERGD